MVRGESVLVFAPLLEAPHLSGERVAPLAAANRPRLAWLSTLLFSRLLAPPSHVDQELVDGQKLPILGGLVAIHTPAIQRATPRSTFPNCGYSISGDAVQVNQDGRLIAPTLHEDYETAVATLRRLARLDLDILVPSHFEPQREGVREQLDALAQTS